MAPRWNIRTGERIYAIGDIHGCADLFADLVARIREDNASRPRLRTRIMVLGDVIDRGPDSAALVERLMRYTRANRRFTVLKGNHEQIMLAALAGDAAAAEIWISNGGAATLESWGLPEGVIADSPLPNLLWQARRRIPRPALRWMSRLPPYRRSGEVLFVHAGIKPGVPLRKQDPLDLMWIRDEFTQSEVVHPFLVVHGHTIVESGPDVRPNRIGVDTGAYRTGRLTALGFEGDRTWSLAVTGKAPCNATLLLPAPVGA